MAEPYPRRSTTDAAAEQLPAEAPQASAVVADTSATFPPELAMLVVPVVSGLGNAAPTDPDEASWTR